MAMLPSGATMRVLTICAPFISAYCRAMGALIFMALTMNVLSHLKGSSSSFHASMLLLNTA